MNLRRLRFIVYLAITATGVAACGNTVASTSVQSPKPAVSEPIPTPVPISTAQPTKVPSFLMQIDDVSVIKGRGTLVTGTVTQGTIQAGAEVEIIGPQDMRLKTAVTGIVILQKLKNQATAGDTAGILVSNIDVEDVKPGMVLAQAGAFASYSDALRTLK